MKTMYLILQVQNNTYSDAELDNLVTAHRNPNFQESGKKMSAYLVVVTQGDPDPNTGRRPLGTPD